jgi:TonB family protein
MSWAHYLLQVNIYLIVFYGFYKFLLDKETYFVLNRIYLVSAAILSFAIPFLRFEWFSQQAAAEPLYIGVGQLNDLMTQVIVEPQDTNVWSLVNLLVLLYTAGVLFFSCRFIRKLYLVGKSLRRQPKNGTAFSFFSKVHVDQEMSQHQTINIHEETHARQLHSLDIIVFEAVAILTWFNPIIYLYKKSIKNIHEYLADEEAAEFQGDKKQYALLLLSSAFGVTSDSLTNSFFNKSLIKKRIFMLYKQRSRRTAILKYGLFLPLFAIALTLSSATIKNNEKIKAITRDLPTENPIEVVTEVVTESIQPIVPKSLKKEPTRNQKIVQAEAGWEEFYQYMKRTVRYPFVAHRDKIQGTTMVKFTLNDGTLENVGIAQKLAGGCDAEVMRKIAVYSGFKDLKNGNYTIKVNFTLSDVNTPKLNTNVAPVKGYTALNEITVLGYGGTKETVQTAIPLDQINIDQNDDKVYAYTSVNEYPSFIGGMQNFYAYLKSSIKYPAEAVKNNTQGKVFLSFIVEKDGALTDIRVERKLGSGTDEEAVRVLEESPKWTPGIVDGKAVRVKYNIPISFSLNKPMNPASPLEKPTGKVEGIRFGDEKGISIRTGGAVTNPPLYVIDGKVTEDVDIKTLNPNEIQSVTVLKDASATAIYGTKGANGVILIVTKGKASPNEKVVPTKKEK